MDLVTPTHMRELVLVGGGHTHVQVLRRFAMAPPAATRITVVLDTPIAVYSGMVPGFVAGQYDEHELEIDVVPLARRAGARVILAPAEGVDPEEKKVLLVGRPPVPYDVVSFDVGSTVRGLDLPGVREYARPTRPIGRFVHSVDAAVKRASADAKSGRFRAVLVGGGVAGVELAFTLQVRLQREGLEGVEIVLLHAEDRILLGSPPSLVKRVMERAEARGIEVRCGAKVASVEEGRVLLEGGGEVDFDLLLWVTGAAGHGLFAGSGLPVDAQGFVCARPTLQVDGHDDIFAVGDCATLRDHPGTAKAGVYAVRQGPYLIDNLRAALEEGELRRYRPQSDFLALLNLGDGAAIGSKWRLSFEGRWVMRLKDWIDRRFMRRFQVLSREGELSEEFPAMDREMSMLCGGCAAKVGQSVLQRALERVGPDHGDGDVVLGLDSADDAAAVRMPGGQLLATSVDMFSAFTDDAWSVGGAAAVNAASDLLATGVRPRYAMALVAVPESSDSEEAEEILFQALSGARAAFGALGVRLLGGHTTTAARLMVGFSVDGFAESEAALFRLDALREGQELLLTKRLGTGVIFHSDMQGLARGRWLEGALLSVLESNAAAFEVLRSYGVEAATDVTGFGLAGHLGEMLRASGASGSVELDSLPALEGAEALLARGLRSTFHAENERARRGIVVEPRLIGDPRLELLFDPQTSGGLLFGVDPGLAPDLSRSLAAVTPVARIGRVVARRDDGALLEVV